RYFEPQQYSQAGHKHCQQLQQRAQYYCQMQRDVCLRPSSNAARRISEHKLTDCHVKEEEGARGCETVSEIRQSDEQRATDESLEAAGGNNEVPRLSIAKR